MTNTDKQMYPDFMPLATVRLVRRLPTLPVKKALMLQNTSLLQKRNIITYPRELITITFPVVLIALLKLPVLALQKKRREMQDMILKWVSFLLWQAEKPVLQALPKVL